MTIKHGETCTCCAKLSKASKKAISEISSFMGPGNVTGEKQVILKQLKQINSKLTPAGGISDIVALAERFFAVNFDEVKPSKLEPKPGDLNKKVGAPTSNSNAVKPSNLSADPSKDSKDANFKGLKIKDITDNPFIDPSKAINFKGLDLSKLSKLKISLTVPTLTVVKTLAFGPVSVGIKFHISLKEIYWGPTIELNMDSIAKALAVLKKSVVTDLITPSMGKKIKDLKDLAKEQLKSSNPSAANDLSNAQTPEEFFEKLSSLQLNLYETVNLGDKAEKIVKDNEEVAKSIRKETTKEVGGILIKKGVDLKQMSQCEPRKPEFAKFNVDDVENAVPCAVKKESTRPLQIQISTQLQEIKEEAAKALEASSAAAAESQKKALDDFLSSVESSNTIMQDCNDKKGKAQSKQWFFKEFDYLHKYVHEFTKKRYEEINSINLLFQSAIQDTVGPALQTKFLNFKDDLESSLGGGSRSTLVSELNPVSNLVGFDNTESRFIVYVNGAIYADAKKIEEDAKASTPNVLFQNYVTRLDFDFIPLLNSDGTVSQPKIRKGVLEIGVWKKYYSPNRIEDLFTWQEQGYTAPKPQFDSTGKVLGAKVNVEIVNGLGVKTIQEIPQSAKDCKVNLEVAVPFLENLEVNTTNKVTKLIEDVTVGAVSKAYVDKLYSLAKFEAKSAFYDYLSSLSNAEDAIAATTTFASSASLYTKLGEFITTSPARLEFEREYQTSVKITEGISDKLKLLQDEVVQHTACIEAQKKNIEDAAKEYAKKSGNEVVGGGDSNNIMKKCKDKLGSDPVGNMPSTNECPTFVKNCYWAEYTKMLQTVSLMPIPELNPASMAKRLFRYYPVALQIPVPTPIPAVLPTLAMGIPDPLISIPLPFLWKHIITINTPFGLFVVWIALAGGIIPNPFVMFIDEDNKAMFLVTPKGPVNLPVSQLGIIKDERLSLLDFIKFTDPLKISLASPLGKLLSGSTRGNPFDPDDSATVIDKVKAKIKKSLDDLEIEDPSFSGRSDAAIKQQNDLKKALEYIPPDVTAIDKALTEVFKMAEKAVDKIKISSITIPKDSKYTAMEMPPIGELMETFGGLVDSALSAPAALAEEILGELGAGVKMLDVKKKINQIARTEMSKPPLKKKLTDMDLEINELESSIGSVDVELDEEAKKKAILARTKKVKSVAVKALQTVADQITPEMLGFVTTFTLPLDLPVPCYTNIALPPMPPWVIAALALIKQAPSLINAFPDEQLIDLLSGVLNLSKALPTAEKLFHAVFNKILDIIPDLILPVGFDATILKQIKDSIKNWLKTFKLRLPKPGLPAPLVIPGSLIKSLIKTAVGAFLSGIKALILAKFNEAINALGPDKVVKIYAVLTIIKLLLGSDLHKLKGTDIKAFVKSLLESIAYPPLDTIKTLITTATALKGEFKSIKATFLPPDPIDVAIKALEPKAPFFEVGAEQIKAFVDPLLNGVVKTLSNSLPFPVILLGCSFPVTRIALTKIHPMKASEKLPNWEGITLKNIPYVVWLDQLAASAQRYSLLGSDYVIPYFTPPTS